LIYYLLDIICQTIEILEDVESIFRSLRKKLFFEI